MRTVHIIGGAPCKEPVPMLPDGVEKWGLNNLITKGSLRARFDGWTMWWDLHTTAHIQKRQPNVYPWECSQDRSVMRWEIDAAMPSSVAYPVGAVRAMFGGTRLFCSSLDWQLAYAIYAGYERIDLYGWRMSNPLYRHQIASGQWWVRQAQDRGIEIVNHSKSTLFLPNKQYPTPIPSPASKMYGLETTDRALLHHAQR